MQYHFHIEVEQILAHFQVGWEYELNVCCVSSYSICLPFAVFVTSTFLNPFVVSLSIICQHHLRKQPPSSWYPCGVLMIDKT